MKYIIQLGIVLALFLSNGLNAASPEEIKSILQSVRADMQILAVNKSEIPGVYAVDIQGGHTLYVAEDGKYFISGDLYTIQSNQFVSVKDLRLKPVRKEMIMALDEEELLTFAPPKDKLKATVYVFTDIDCGYCRKLHQEIPELNNLGISIKYLAFPRAGVNSESYNKAVSAWCSDKPEQAMTRAKSGQAIPAKTCANPVAKHYYLGQELGVNGTPAIIYEDGTLQPGYVPAKELASRLGVL